MARPRVRILSIGDELLYGRTTDTNAGHLARRATDAGLVVVGIGVVGDGEDGILAALAAAGDVDLLLVTGGLGPTDDDRTRHALARFLGDPLEEDPAAWRSLCRRWTRLRPGAIPPSNRRQVLRPASARFLANDRGTAPGLLARRGATWIACLPGVPHEMRAMADRLFRRLPRLLPGIPRQTVAELHLAGTGESAVQELLGGAFTEGDPQVGITALEAGHLTLRVVGSPARVRAAVAGLRPRVASWLLPGPGLAASLVAALDQRGMTVTTAESCTVGLVAAALGAVPGASRVLHEAVVAYAPQVKARRLRVPPAALAQVVSAACVEAMARGARRASGADLAISTSGIAGPGGGTPEDPVGTVWIAVADARGVVSRRVRLDGDRTRIQARAAAEALLLAWQRLAT